MNDFGRFVRRVFGCLDTFFQAKLQLDIYFHLSSSLMPGMWFEMYAVYDAAMNDPRLEGGRGGGRRGGYAFNGSWAYLHSTKD